MLKLSKVARAVSMSIPSSISKLTLLGFLLVILPLVAAIIHANWQVDRLASRMQELVSISSAVGDSGRVVQSKVLSMERSAGQFLVLGEASLLQRYEEQREQFLYALKQLFGIARQAKFQQQLHQIQDLEQELYDKLLNEKVTSETMEQLTTDIHHLTSLVQPLPYEISRIITERQNDIDQDVQRIQRLLLWQVLAVIPLALLLVVIISSLLNRPLQHLKYAIHRLGDGELDTPVVVNGPQDIRELGQRLDWLRVRLNELDQQKLMFLQHVSHELKTPLTAIREGTELLLDGVTGYLKNEQSEVVEIIRDSSTQLQAQVEALLGFNSALLQKSPSRNEKVRFDCVLDEVIEQHRLAARARQVDLLPQIEMITVSGDYEQLRVLSGTLLSNAIKFSPVGGTIHIRLRQIRSKALLDIIDQGPGVHSSDEKKIFEPFFQGRNMPKTHVKGTGLGLAIASRYAHLHNGQVELQRVVSGAHFRVTLPAEKRFQDKQEDDNLGDQ